MSKIDSLTQEQYDALTLEEHIDFIPGDEGWWKSGARDAYLHLARELVVKGFTKGAAADLLSSAYWAAADCFGGT